MFGAADRAVRAREKHGAALKRLVIDFNTGRDRAPGLRAFDHDHSHVTLPQILFVLVS